MNIADPAVITATKTPHQSIEPPSAAALLIPISSIATVASDSPITIIIGPTTTGGNSFLSHPVPNK